MDEQKNQCNKTLRLTLEDCLKEVELCRRRAGVGQQEARGRSSDTRGVRCRAIKTKILSIIETLGKCTNVPRLESKLMILSSYLLMRRDIFIFIRKM